MKNEGGVYFKGCKRLLLGRCFFSEQLYDVLARPQDAMKGYSKGNTKAEWAVPRAMTRGTAHSALIFSVPGLGPVDCRIIE